MAARILGMGDVLSLIEDAHKQVDQAEAAKLAKKLKTGKGFDLEDFKMQLQQMQKMGGLSALMDKLPGNLAQAAQGKPVDDKALGRVEGIINSMTTAERRHPEILKASRKRRIAAGAGVPVQEINRLLNQFEQMQKMMKPKSFSPATDSYVAANLDSADYAVYLAGLQGIYLMVPVVDQWNYYHGGKGVFVHWAYQHRSLSSW